MANYVLDYTGAQINEALGKVSNLESNTLNINASNISEEGLNKLSSDLEINTKVNMEQATTYSMPSDKFVTLTIGASGSSYIAPTNGYIRWNIPSAGVKAGTFISIESKNDRNETLLYNASQAYKAMPLGVSISVRSGQSFSIYYVGTSNDNNIPNIAFLNFIYAEGSKPIEGV